MRDSSAPVDDSFLARLRILEARVGREVVMELINLLISDTPMRLKAIATALAERSPDEVCSTAHALKGSASALGANALSDACFALEQLGRSGTIAGGEELLTRIRLEYEQLLIQCEAIKKGEIDTVSEVDRVSENDTR